MPPRGFVVVSSVDDLVVVPAVVVVVCHFVAAVTVGQVVWLPWPVVPIVSRRLSKVRAVYLCLPVVVVDLDVAWLRCPPPGSSPVPSSAPTAAALQPRRSALKMPAPIPVR